MCPALQVTIRSHTQYMACRGHLHAYLIVSVWISAFAYVITLVLPFSVLCSRQVLAGRAQVCWACWITHPCTRHSSASAFTVGLMVLARIENPCLKVLCVLAAYALGFLDCDNISARCMLSIFQFFATKTDASRLRMLNGSPADRLLRPITDYLEARGTKIHTRTGAR